MPGSVSSELSTNSVSRVIQNCPYCQKDFQIRSIFHHIRIHHPSEFLERTQKQFIADAEKGRPLKMFWYTNIDEELGHEDVVIIYGCLATDKCFATEERAMRHFKHNPDALKKHNLQLNILKKEFQANKKKKKEEQNKINPVEYAHQKALRENNPKLIEGLWRGMLHWKQGCDLAVTLGNYYFKDDFEYEIAYAYPFPKKSKWSHERKRYEKLCYQAKTALEENNQNASYLQSIYHFFWEFITLYKKNIISITDIDPRLDDRCPESIIVWRDESVLDEEYFFVATKKMPLPTAEDFVPKAKAAPLESIKDDIALSVQEPAMTQQQVAEVLLTEQDIKKLKTSVATGQEMEVPELDALLKKPKPQTAARPIIVPKATVSQRPQFPTIINNTKRPMKSVSSGAL